MAYLEERTAERVDPSLLVPRASTVICVAVDYHQGVAPPLPPQHGRVARYAHGRDYHNVVSRRLLKLSRFVRAELPGARVYKSVDTGPVLERSWAAQSGVASFGKSGNALTEEQGSWLLLGQLVVDRDLPVDLPAPDLCGECVACIAACPTGAIVEPGLVDSRRCISYLTIEHRGPIDVTLRDSLSEWVFGCDDCQTACPLTGDERPSTDRAFARIDGRATLDAAEILHLDDEAFHARFHGSPLRRAGAPSLRRNAALRLGNAGDATAVPALEKALGEDPSPVVRGASAWSLSKLSGAAARPRLSSALSSEPDASVVDEIEQALDRS